MSIHSLSVYRIRSPLDFRRVYSNSKKQGTRDFLLLYCENNLPQARLGLSIRKKHISKAVLRNRLKRLVWEQFRQVSDSLPPLDIVFHTRRPLTSEQIELIPEELKSKWIKLQT